MSRAYKPRREPVYHCFKPKPIPVVKLEDGAPLSKPQGILLELCPPSITPPAGMEYVYVRFREPNTVRFFIMTDERDKYGLPLDEGDEVPSREGPIVPIPVKRFHLYKDRIAWWVPEDAMPIGKMSEY